MATKRGTSSSSTKATDWHPSDDGLDQIAAALEAFAQASHPQRDLLMIHSTCPSNQLASEVFRTMDSQGNQAPPRLEIIRRWLQFNNRSADAVELDQTVRAVIELVKGWEVRALDPQGADLPDANDPDDSEASTGYSRRVWDDFYAVQDQATFAADYVRQLAWMIRNAADVKQQSAQPQQDNQPTASTNATREQPPAARGSEERDSAALAGKPGRQNETSDIADFANAKRKLVPPVPWSRLPNMWLQDHPDDERVDNSSAPEEYIRSCWRRHYGDKKTRS
jgi:hypothetical protein